MKYQDFADIEIHDMLDGRLCFSFNVSGEECTITASYRARDDLLDYLIEKFEMRCIE